MAHAFLKALGSVEVIQRCKKVPFESRKAAARAGNGTTMNMDLLMGVGTRRGRPRPYVCRICRAWHCGRK